MKRSDYPTLIGKAFGYWTVIDLSDEQYRVKCRCRCGTEKDILVNSLLNGKSTSCGCRREELYTASRDSTRQKIIDRCIGKQFGAWTVEKLSESNPEKVTCICKCGTVRDVAYRSLIKGLSTSCGCEGHRWTKERKKRIAEDNAQKLLNAAEGYVGQTINDFLIKRIYVKKYNGNNQIFCTAICPICGNETDTLLRRIKDGMKKCAKCSRNIKDINAVAGKVDAVSGTKLSSINARCKGTVNKNSGTGINGVSRMKNGTFRAYINLRRKQYHLGTYPTLEEAAMARKRGEEIYKNILSENGNWEEEYRLLAKELNEKASNPAMRKCNNNS